MNPFRSVGGRLSLALLVVVAGALAIVYGALVPTLERNLVDAKVSQVRQAAENLRDRVPDDQFARQIFVEDNAPSVNARVLVVEPLFGTPTPVALVVADSQTGPEQQLTDVLALRAVSSGRIQSGRIDEGGRPYAEAAVPIVGGGPVLVVRSPLADTLKNVDLVRRRLLVAGVAALAVSLLAGYGLAWLFARRLRRLEQAAERIASGRFDEPVRDAGRDEVGELAGAFDRMRVRLAGLERARRDFIANASHELRTPIFSLGGFLELLDDEELDEETRREFLQTARQQVVRLTKLATDLLDLSRLDAGRVQVARARVDLGAVARVLRDEFEAVARPGQHVIDASVGGQPLAVGDEQRTLQIGRILLENAIVHTPPGTLVHLRVGRQNGRAVLAVEDEGPGIPESMHEHVFERFARVDGGIASGSGLGLAIAKELAELMGGSIELESRPGSTRFLLALPSAA